MGIETLGQRMLRASVCEVERGLFYVTYRLDGPGPTSHLLPRYQVGTCALDAQSRVEESARACGYNAIIWGDEVVDAGILASVAQEAPRVDR